MNEGSSSRWPVGIAAKSPHLFQRDIERIVNIILDRIIDAMASGDRVELRDFGTFSVRFRDARKGRNPKTGEALTVARKMFPHFKSGRTCLRSAVFHLAPIHARECDGAAAPSRSLNGFEAAASLS